MRIDQYQCYCNRCQTHTLHQRTVNEVNHVLHLLISLFCCWLWFPIWMLMAFVASFERPPYLCSACGQTAGEITPEQRQEILVWQREQRQRRAIANAEWRANASKNLGQTAMVLASAAGASLAVAGQQAVQLPGRTDRMLRYVSGEGNDILFWFFRIATIATVSGMFIAILVLVAGGAGLI